MKPFSTSNLSAAARGLNGHTAIDAMATSRWATRFWALLDLMLLTLSASVQAQFTYTTDNGTITITGYPGFDGAVAIPGTIEGLPVTRIGDHAFHGTTLTSVTPQPRHRLAPGTRDPKGAIAPDLQPPPLQGTP